MCSHEKATAEIVENNDAIKPLKNGHSTIEISSATRRCTLFQSCPSREVSLHRVVVSDLNVYDIILFVYVYYSVT